MLVLCFPVLPILMLFWQPEQLRPQAASFSRSETVKLVDPVFRPASSPVRLGDG